MATALSRHQRERSSTPTPRFIFESRGAISDPLANTGLQLIPCSAVQIRVVPFWRRASLPQRWRSALSGAAEA